MTKPLTFAPPPSSATSGSLPTKPGWVVPSIRTCSVTGGRPVVLMTNGGVPWILKAMMSAPGLAFAAVIASRRLHVPSQLLPITVSAVAFTVNVMAARAACGGRRANSIEAVSNAVDRARTVPRPTLSPSPDAYPAFRPTAGTPGEQGGTIGVVLRSYQVLRRSFRVNPRTPLPH